MNYCLQTMSFQPKNKIKHPHTHAPKDNKKNNKRKKQQ